MRTLILCLALAGFLTAGSPAFGSQEQLLEQCAEMLSGEPALAGSFRQEKHLDFLEEPLVSTGSFSIRNPGNLTWHVVEPFESVMEVRGTTVTLDGERVRGHGIGRMMSMLMGGFTQGEFDGIVRHFDVTGAVGETSWELTLTARSSRMKSAMEKVELGGGRYMNFLNIHEKDGNRTLIQFEDVRPLESHEQHGQ